MVWLGRPEYHIKQAICIYTCTRGAARTFGKRENSDVVVHVDEWEYPAVVRSRLRTQGSARAPRRFGADSEMWICEDASNVVVGVLVLRYR